jgi:hypothetical protein
VIFLIIRKSLKKFITASDVSDLQNIGMKQIYGIKELYPVPDFIIAGAQGQIAAGLAIFFSSAIFPWSLTVTGQIANTFIFEGLSDIATALIDQGETKPSFWDKMKAKGWSYLTSIGSIGIGSLMRSVAFLNKIKNGVQKASEWLKKCEKFKGIANFLAKQLDKIAKYIENLVEKLNTIKDLKAAYKAGDASKIKEQTNLLNEKLGAFRTSDPAKMLEYKNFAGQSISTIQQSSSFTSLAWGSTQSIAKNLFMENIFNAGLKNLMSSSLKPSIEKAVKEKVEAIILDEDNQNIINFNSEKVIQEKLDQIFIPSNYESITSGIKDFTLKLASYASNNWRVQLGALALEGTVVTGYTTNCTSSFCTKFIDNIKNKEFPNNPLINRSREDLRSLVITPMSSRISEIIYQTVVAYTEKAIPTLYSAYSNYNQEQKEKKELKKIENNNKEIVEKNKKAEEKNARCGHDAAAKTLGVDSEKLAAASGIQPSEAGLDEKSLNDLYGKVGIDTTEGNINNENDLKGKLSASNSDRGIIHYEDKDGNRHAVAFFKDSEGKVTFEDNDGTQKSFDDLKQQFKDGSANIIVPKNLNAQNLDSKLATLNHNYVYNAANELEHRTPKLGEGIGARNAKEKKEEKKIQKEIKNLQGISSKPTIKDGDIFRIGENQALVEGYVESTENNSESRPGLAMHHLYSKDKIKEEMVGLTAAELKRYYNELSDQEKTAIKAHLSKGNSFQDAIAQTLYYDHRNIRIGPKPEIRHNDPGNAAHDYALIEPKLIEGFENAVSSGNILEKIKAIGSLNLPQPIFKWDHKVSGWVVKGFVPLNREAYLGGDFYNKNKKWNVFTGNFENKHNAGDLELLEKRISSKEYWLNYNEKALETILEQRLLYNKSINMQNIKIFKTLVITNSHSNYFNFYLSEVIQNIKQSLNTDNQDMKVILPILISQSAYVSHWVGTIFEKVGNVIKITYLDSENQLMPSILTNALVSELNHNVVLYQPLLETQRYNNCGPETIENTNLILTGSRPTQEGEIPLHSLLYENSVLDPVLSAPQIEENNRLIKQLSNQKQPIYLNQLKGVILDKALVKIDLIQAEDNTQELYDHKSSRDHDIAVDTKLVSASEINYGCVTSELTQPLVVLTSQTDTQSLLLFSFAQATIENNIPLSINNIAKSLTNSKDFLFDHIATNQNNDAESADYSNGLFGNLILEFAKQIMRVNDLVYDFSKIISNSNSNILKTAIIGSGIYQNIIYQMLNYAYGDELVEINNLITKDYIRSSSREGAKILLNKYPLTWDKQDFKKIKLVVHPDKNGNAEDFRIINEFEKLSNGENNDLVYSNLYHKLAQKAEPLMQEINSFAKEVSLYTKGTDIVTDIAKMIIKPSVEHNVSLVRDFFMLYSKLSNNIDAPLLYIAPAVTIFEVIQDLSKDNLTNEDYLKAGMKVIHGCSYLLNNNALPYGTSLYLGVNALTAGYDLYQGKYLAAFLQGAGVVGMYYAPAITGAIYGVSYSTQNLYSLYKLHNQIKQEAESKQILAFTEMTNDLLQNELNKINIDNNPELQDFIKDISPNMDEANGAKLDQDQNILYNWNKAHRTRLEQETSYKVNSELLSYNIVRDLSDDKEFIIPSSISFKKNVELKANYNLNEEVTPDNDKIANDNKIEALKKSFAEQFSYLSHKDYSILEYTTISSNSCKLHSYILDMDAHPLEYASAALDDIKLCGELLYKTVTDA